MGDNGDSVALPTLLISQFLGQRYLVFPEFFYLLWGFHMVCRFPGVMGIGVSCPPDSVLELSRPSVAPGVYNLLHFPFFFSIYDVWGRFGEVGSVFLRFLIWGD